jgi:hypothetical protein
LTEDSSPALSTQRDRLEQPLSSIDRNFNGLSEPTWTLAMALTWIIWRTERAVRENCLEYRLTLWPDQSEPFAVDATISDVRGLYDRAGNPNNLQGGVFTTPVAVSFNDALRGLRKRLRAQDLIANGIHDLSAELSQVLYFGLDPIRGDESAVDEQPIPSSAWNNLILENQDFCGRPDDIGHKDNTWVPRYRSVRLQAKDVMRLWPPIETEPGEAAASAAEEIQPQTEADPKAAYKTGAPGRPSPMFLVVEEAARRRQNAETLERVTDEAKYLRSWCAANHRGIAAPSAKTIKNKISLDHSLWKGKTPTIKSADKL